MKILKRTIGVLLLLSLFFMPSIFGISKFKDDLYAVSQVALAVIVAIILLFILAWLFCD